jgi:hypothetical protein
LIYVTKEEHYKIHELRFRVYNSSHDQQAIHATYNDWVQASGTMESAQEALQIHQKTKEENIRKVYLSRRTPETLDAVSKGMRWVHKSGIRVDMLPNTAQTIQEIRTLLIQGLPADHKDRQRILLNTASSHTYIRQHIQTIFKIDGSPTKLNTPRNSVYGFVVYPLKSM